MPTQMYCIMSKKVKITQVVPVQVKGDADVKSLRFSAMQQPLLILYDSFHSLQQQIRNLLKN